MINYLYDNFKEDVNTLLQELNSEKFDTILAITRGGMTLAQALAHGLNIRNVQTLQAISYDNETKHSEVKIHDTCNISQSTNILIVDDISDSGDTLDAVLKHLKRKNTTCTLSTCTLFYKKDAVIIPDFKVHEATEWINFFWEIDFTSNS